MRTSMVACAVLFAGSPARAEDQPEFHPACSYRATHVVVAAAEPGGRFKVAESWKGDLKPGDTLTIPALEKDAKGDMVLFLGRDGDSWRPAGIGDGWLISVAWFDGEKVLAIQQGDREMAVVSEYVNSRKEFKQIVAFYLDTERAFAAARAIEDSGERAAAFEGIVNGRYDRKDEAFEELGRCGPKALPALRAYLKGPPDYQQQYAVRAMPTAGGKDVVPELHAMLEAELSYWRKVGPTLEKSWWLADHTMNEPAMRFATLGRLVSVYEDYPTPAFRETVVAVRDLLRTIPAIDGDKRIGNMSDHCDLVLKKGDR